MSYDISFRVKIEGVDEYFDTRYCEANITWNVRNMIVKSTGLEWKNNENNGLCKDIIPAICQGYVLLTQYPEQYEQYESPNGWGTIRGTKRFFETIIKAWDILKLEQPKLADVATLWIT